MGQVPGRARRVGADAAAVPHDHRRPLLWRPVAGAASARLHAHLRKHAAQRPKHHAAAGRRLLQGEGGGHAAGLWHARVHGSDRRLLCAAGHAQARVPLDPLRGGLGARARGGLLPGGDGGQLPVRRRAVHAHRRVQARAQPARGGQERGGQGDAHREGVLVCRGRPVLPGAQPGEPRAVRALPRAGRGGGPRLLRRPARLVQVLQHGPGHPQRARDLRQLQGARQVRPKAAPRGVWPW
mmetsp:Transcript_45046/g.149304  ORF Transcript_45046/g.149304 Transcript_45046/m.149304 type:complete len:239 (+) Transcript_45046:723-1439(+)